MQNDAVELMDNRPLKSPNGRKSTPDRSKKAAVAKVVQQQQNKKQNKKKGLFGFLKRGKKKKKGKEGSFPKKKGLQARVDDHDSI